MSAFFVRADVNLEASFGVPGFESGVSESLSVFIPLELIGVAFGTNDLVRVKLLGVIWRLDADRGGFFVGVSTVDESLLSELLSGVFISVSEVLISSPSALLHFLVGVLSLFGERTRFLGTLA